MVQTNPRIIPIESKKFVYEPAELTLKLNEPVVSQLTSLDVMMGFSIPDFGVRARFQAIGAACENVRVRSPAGVCRFDEPQPAIVAPQCENRVDDALVNRRSTHGAIWELQES